MLFNSLQFWLFYGALFAVLLLLSHAKKRAFFKKRNALFLRVRNGFILAASYIFYSTWDYRFLGLIITTTVVDYTCSLGISRLSQKDVRRKHLLGVSLIVNLGVLAFFKYYGFFVQSAADLLGALGLNVSLQVLKITLPVGVSFYTFQSLSYTVDVYRRRIEAERNIVHYATFIAFFPQLVAGPIERAGNLLGQLKKISRFDSDALFSGMFLAGSGLFKKVVIADNLARVSEAVFSMSSPTGAQALVGAYAFAIQIYCDFSGYTDIARGTARALGLKLCLNFNLPYFSSNPSEFWRGWHISLSSWLRDYLYIGLGGNRSGSFNTYRNLMLTMLLGGLWHGAAWTFVAWGAYHGALLVIYRLLQPVKKSIPRPSSHFVEKTFHVLAIVFFFHLVCVGWIFFRADSIGQAWMMISGIFFNFGTVTLKTLDACGPWLLGASVAVPLFFVQLCQYKTGDLNFILNLPVPLRAAVYAVGCVLFYNLGVFGESPFIYFQF